MKTRKRPKSYRCPTELTLDVLGGKWKTVILCFLKERPYRYAELRKLMPNLSDKILTERLNDLIACGLVLKKRAPGQARIAVYVLTDRARSLQDILGDLYVWGKSHSAEFGVEIEDSLKNL
jgi:DNA-binding HxlR family transcriptional regulator